MPHIAGGFWHTLIYTGCAETHPFIEHLKLTNRESTNPKLVNFQPCEIHESASRFAQQTGQVLSLPMPFFNCGRLVKPSLYNRRCLDPPHNRRKITMNGDSPVYWPGLTGHHYHPIAARNDSTWAVISPNRPGLFGQWVNPIRRITSDWKSISYLAIRHLKTRLKPPLRVVLPSIRQLKQTAIDTTKKIHTFIKKIHGEV